MPKKTPETHRKGKDKKKEHELVDNREYLQELDIQREASLTLHWSKLAKITRGLFCAVLLVNILSFYKCYVYYGFNAFVYIGCALILLSISLILISIFGYEDAIYWAAYF